MDCACFFHKMSLLYFKKRFYIQVFRLTVRRYYRWRQHGPAWKCNIQKTNLQKNARNHGKVTKRIFELHRRAINAKKRLQSICFLEECRKGFNFCWTSKANGEPESAQQKKDFWEALHIRGAYLHAFQTNGQICHTCLGPPKLRWPRAPRSLNPSLSTPTLFPRVGHSIPDRHTR